MCRQDCINIDQNQSSSVILFQDGRSHGTRGCTPHWVVSAFWVTTDLHDRKDISHVSHFGLAKLNANFAALFPNRVNADNATGVRTNQNLNKVAFVKWCAIQPCAKTVNWADEDEGKRKGHKESDDWCDENGDNKKHQGTPILKQR